MGLSIISRAGINMGALVFLEEDLDFQKEVLGFLVVVLVLMGVLEESIFRMLWEAKAGKNKEIKAKNGSKHVRTVLVLEVHKDRVINFDLYYLTIKHRYNWTKSILVIFFFVRSFNANSNVFSLVLFQESKFSAKCSQMKTSHFFIKEFR